MKKLTKEKFCCSKCGKLRFLVVLRGRGYLCEKCYEDKLIKMRTLRNLNRMVVGK